MVTKSAVAATTRAEETKKPKGSERTNKMRDELMKSQAIQTLLDSTIRRLSSSEKALLNLNRPLIHIMEYIDQAPGGRISTNELLRNIKSYNMHRHLKEGEQLGYIKREAEKQPTGQKGGAMIMNSLTESGHLLLALADELLDRKQREQI